MVSLFFWGTFHSVSHTVSSLSKTAYPPCMPFCFLCSYTRARGSLSRWVFSIVFTTLVVNLRHVLMSAAVAPWFAPFTRIQQFIIGWGLTDEVFATHSMAMAKGEEARLPAVYAVNFTAHGGWILGTFIGAVAGDFLPDPKLFGLDYALPAMFLALLVPQCKDHVYTAAAILSALLSVILALCGIGRWNVIVASVVTSSLGALFLTYRDRCFLCRSKI